MRKETEEGDVEQAKKTTARAEMMTTARLKALEPKSQSHQSSRYDMRWFQACMESAHKKSFIRRNARMQDENSFVPPPPLLSSAIHCQQGGGRRRNKLKSRTGREIHLSQQNKYILSLMLCVETF